MITETHNKLRKLTVIPAHGGDYPIYACYCKRGEEKAHIKRMRNKLAKYMRTAGVTINGKLHSMRLDEADELDIDGMMQDDLLLFETSKTDALVEKLANVIYVMNHIKNVGAMEYVATIETEEGTKFYLLKGAPHDAYDVWLDHRDKLANSKVIDKDSLSMATSLWAYHGAQKTLDHVSAAYMDANPDRAYEMSVKLLMIDAVALVSCIFDIVAEYFKQPTPDSTELVLTMEGAEKLIRDYEGADLLDGLITEAELRAFK